jgi:hypothetical protein
LNSPLDVSMVDVRKTALAQVARRIAGLGFGLPEQCPLSDEEAAKLIFDRALRYATAFHKQHKWDSLPHESARDVRPGMQELLEWQDGASVEFLKGEHKMSLVGFFVAIGVGRPLAGTIVDYIVAREA